MMRFVAVFVIATSLSPAQTTPPAHKNSSAGASDQSSSGAAHRATAPPALPSYKDLKYPPRRPIPIPAIESSTLPNGMRLYLLENHELPLINGMVVVRTGDLLDPPGMTGLASLTGNLLIAGGSTARPGDDLPRRFQGLGAEIGSSVTENTAIIDFSALKDNADEVLDVLKDVLTAPEFQQDRLDLAKVQLFNAIAHRNDDPATVVQREFTATVYGKDTPYGRQAEYSTLERIDRHDLVSFYQRYYFPKNVMLALEGDFDSARMKTRIEALFSEWNATEPPAPAFPKASTEGAPGRFLAARKDIRQSYFAVGQIGVDYLDKDYPAMQIVAEILGGGPQARLNRRLRGYVNNLTATAAASFGHPGLFEISGVADSFPTTQVIRTVLDELTRMRTAEVTEEELKIAKDAALNRLVFTFDTQLAILSRLAQYEYFSLPRDLTEQYQKGLEAVTREDVMRVSRDRLNPATMTVIVVGNPTGFETPLQVLGGAVIPIDLTIPPPARREAVLGDPVSLRRGKELLQRAQQAMGGADKLAAVKDYVEETSYQFAASAGGSQGTETERWLAAGSIRQDSVFPTGKLSVYCDGKSGWIGASQGSSGLNEVQLKQVQGDMFRVPFTLLLSDRLPSRKVNALDEDTVEISDGAGQVVKAVFDSATGLVKSLLYDAVTANGPVPVIETFSDYRDTDGLKLPFKVAVTLAGQKYQELTVTSFRLNSGLRIQDLERRP